jgi:diguanylate cyclase (GGDEF)-like protein/PAS domain S-box-containing protein
MRKNILLPVVFLVTLLASLAVIIYAARIYNQDGLLFGGETADFTAGWKTGDGEAVSLPGTVRADADGSVELYNTLPAALEEEGNVLSLRTSYQSLDVTVNGEGIYTWDIRDKAMFLKPFGLSTYLISIPVSAAGQTVELKLTPNQQGSDIRIDSIALGSGVTSAVALISENVGTILLFCLLAILFVLIAAFAVVFRKRYTGQSTSDALYLSAFVALSAVWILSDSSLLLLLTPNVAATFYISLFSLMLLPVPLLLFMRRYTRHGKMVLDAVASLVLLNFFVCLFLLYFGVADLVQTLFTSHILELVSAAVVLTLCLYEFIRYRRRDAAEVFFGFGLLCLCAVGAVAAYSMKGNSESALLSHTGLTVFVLALGSGVARRGIQEMARSKSYEKLTLTIPSGICRIESFDTSRIVFANEFFYRMFGYTEEEAQEVGFTTADYTVLPSDLRAMKEKIKKHFAVSTSRFETEVRHVRKDGEIIWILARYRMDMGGFGPITLVMIDITDRKQMEEKLRISEEEYRIATLHSNKLIFRLDIRTRTSYCQSTIPSVFTDVPSVMENVPESILSSGMVAQDSTGTFKGFFDAIYAGGHEGNAVVSLYDRKAGEYRWYHFDFTSIFDDLGKPAQAIITFYDVTLQRQKELAFQRWQQSYNSIPKSASNYYEYNLTDDRFEHEEGGMLPSFPEDIPWKLRDIASYVAEHYVYADDAENWLSFMSRDKLLERYTAGQHTDKTEFRRLKDGEPKWTSVSVQLIPDPYSSDVKGYFLLEDIDEQKKAVINLQERSTHDSLTGLLNRAAFIEKFNEILLRSDLETQHALIMLDIDNFKAINDTLGHNTGDALLINVASKLKYALRSDDLCGRLGGDEFVICLKSMNLGKPLETRVNDLCNMIYDDHSSGVSVSASFGIAGFPYDGLTFDELYKKADIALYKAKSQGRGGFAVYDPQLSFDDMSVPLKHS